jgi:hypothetical protein
MPQCKAETASGTQCVSEVVAPSRTLCKRHQNMLASGKTVVNAETGRKFPVTATSATGAPKAAAKNGTTARAGATSRSASAARRTAAPAPARATATRAPRAVAAAPAAAPAFAGATATAERTRGPGEHSLHCGGPGCTNMSLPGSDYCMQHQNLA